MLSEIFSKIKITYIIAIVCVVITWNFLISVVVEKTPPKTYDECMGVHLEPEKEYISSREGFGKIKTDRFGFNNDPIENPVDKNIANIIFLGDSYTEAAYINRSNNYVKMTEKLLNDSGYEFRSINLGVSGNAVPDHIYNASCFIETFAPKYTVIQLYSNDFIEEALESENGNKIVKNDNGYAIEHVPQTKKRLAHYIDRITGWFQPISFRFIENIMLISKVGTIDERNKKAQNLLGKEKEEIANIVEWQMQKLQQLYGRNLIILYFPPTPYIIDGAVTTEKNPARDLLFEVAKKNNIEIFNTEDILVKYYKETRRMAHGFPNTQPGLGHLNKDGNYLVANFLYRYLSDNPK